MTDNALLVLSDEHGVVVRSGIVCRRLGALINQSSTDKLAEYVAVNFSLAQQVSVGPPHIPAGRRKDELLFLPGYRFLSSALGFTPFTIQ